MWKNLMNIIAIGITFIGMFFLRLAKDVHALGGSHGEEKGS
jgi:hypothetical protein